MKKLLFGFTLMTIALTSDLFAQVNSSYHYVQPHYRSNGTYVDGYYRTNPNNSVYDNYSTYPNVNPHTGSVGTYIPELSNSFYIREW